MAPKLWLSITNLMIPFAAQAARVLPPIVSREHDLPRPRWLGESDAEREGRRLAAFLPLAVGAAIPLFLILLWWLL